jgi:hypothetical protein
VRGAGEWPREGVRVEERRELTRLGVAEDSPRGEACDEGAPREPLEVDRYGISLAAELPRESAEPADRLCAAALQRELAASEDVKAVERRMVSEKRSGLGLDGPPDLCSRKRAARELERRESVDDVAEGREADEDEARDVLVRIVHTFRLTAWAESPRECLAAS